MTTSMVLDSPPARFALEAGYDTQGRFVYDQVALDPAGDPLTQSVDEVRRTRIRNGRFELLDAQGLSVTGDETPPTLQSVFGTSSTDPLVILDGMVVTEFPQVSARVQSRDGSTSTVSDVTRARGVVTVSSTLRSSDPTIPDLPQRRTYVASGSEYVLSEIQTDIATTTPGARVTGRATLRFESVTWNRNAAKDDARRSGTAPSVWGTGIGEGATTNAEPTCEPPAWDPNDTPVPGDCTGPGGGNGSSGGTGGSSGACSQVAGGANIVYVHGIKASGSSWGRAASGNTSEGGVIGPVRCALAIATDATPSLTQGGAEGTGRHTQQAAQLLGVVQNRNVLRTIFVAHSQGGLISRRVAQTPWAQQPDHVRAVVTTGTPHLGAPLAKSLNPGPGTNGIINAFSAGGSACRFGACSTVRGSLVALRDGLLAGVFSSPAMSDLRPASAAIAELNQVTEAFPNYGIQNEIHKRWAVAQVGGDYFNNSGESLRRTVEAIYYVALGTAFVTGIVSFFVPWVAPAAIAAFYTVSELDSTDRWWTRITVGDASGDGVVPYASQVYPRAIHNYRALEPVSHTAEIDTKKSSRAITKVLRERVGVADR